MKITIAMDSLKRSLSLLEAVHAAARGIKMVYPNADISARALVDGEQCRLVSAQWAENTIYSSHSTSSGTSLSSSKEKFSIYLFKPAHSSFSFTPFCVSVLV